MKSSKGQKQAVVIIHGIGNQLSMQTARQDKKGLAFILPMIILVGI